MNTRKGGDLNTIFNEGKNTAKKCGKLPQNVQNSLFQADNSYLNP